MKKVPSTTGCADTLKALGDATRLQVLQALLAGPLHVNDLMEKIDVEQSLLSHHLKVLREARLGHVDTVHDKLVAHLHGEPERTQRELRALGMLPPWLGRRDLHRAYRSALVRKDPEHYLPLFPDVPDDLEYVWPV